MSNVIIHIGYPKTASTFLQQYFSEHPAVFYTGSLLDDYKRTGEIVLRLPALGAEQTHLAISEEQLSVWQGNLDIVGVKFKPYDIAVHQQKTAKALYAQFPEAKILIVTRGFSAVLYSMYSQYVSIGGILTFDEYEKAYGKIIADFYDYNFLIDTYRSVFGKENVVVLPFEMLRLGAVPFIEYINTTFALPDINFDAEKKNASLNNDEIESYRKLSKALFLSIQWLPYSIQQKIYGAYVYFLYARKFPAFTKLFASKNKLPGINPETLTLFKGRAEILRNESLFAPYLKEYLL